MTSPFATEEMQALRTRLLRPTPAPAPKPMQPAQADPQPRPDPRPPATGRPFDTEVLRGFKQRARRRTNLDTLRVWNGNEGPTLEQLVDAMPPEGGIAALIEDMERSR